MFIAVIVDLEEYLYHKVLSPELPKEVVNIINKSYSKCPPPPPPSASLAPLPPILLSYSLCKRLGGEFFNNEKLKKLFKKWVDNL